MDLTSSGTLRRGLSAVAVSATLPYLTLKLLWLSGSTVGITDPAQADDPILWTLNLVTFGMDAAALLLAAPSVLFHAYWAFGGRTGMPISTEASHSLRVMALVWAVLAVAACAALLTVVFRLAAHRPLRARLGVIWLAGGSLFAWGA